MIIDFFPAAANKVHFFRKVGAGMICRIRRETMQNIMLSYNLDATQGNFGSQAARVLIKELHVYFFSLYILWCQCVNPLGGH